MNQDQSSSKENVIAYLVIGESANYYLQAHFSLLSFLIKHPECNYLVITDHPDYFKTLNRHKNIHVQEVKQAELKTWYGSHKYFFRAKIKCLQLANRLFPAANLVLIDSDTVLVKSFKQNFNLLSSGNACLFHCSEGPMSKRRGKTSKGIWAHLKGKSYFEIPVPDTYCLMNSGVLGFPNANIQHTLENTLKINDTLLDEKMPGFTHEQIAFNIAAMGSYQKLLTCEADLLHYWGNKEEWQDAIKDFFLDCYLKGLDPLDNFEEHFSHLLGRLPIIKQKKSMAKRIYKFADKIPLKKNIHF